MSHYISDKRLVPRKRHYCSICDVVIEKGETCHAYTGAKDGRIYTAHYHPMCWTYSRSWDWADWQYFGGGMDRREMAIDIIAGRY